MCPECQQKDRERFKKYWLYACREEKKRHEKRKKRNRQHCTQHREYNDQSFRQNYERLGKRLGIEGIQEPKPEKNEPLRKICVGSWLVK